MIMLIKYVEYADIYADCACVCVFASLCVIVCVCVCVCVCVVENREGQIW